MKMFVLLCLVAAAVARPQDLLDSPARQESEARQTLDPAPQSDAPQTLEEAGILRSENVINEDGSFSYGFETADQIIQEVTGQIKQIGEEQGVVMQGRYSFIAKDENGEDVPVEIRWTADENGYRAEGDSIPEGAGGQAAAAAAAAADLGASGGFDDLSSGGSALSADVSQ